MLIERRRSKILIFPPLWVSNWTFRRGEVCSCCCCCSLVLFGVELILKELNFKFSFVSILISQPEDPNPLQVSEGIDFGILSVETCGDFSFRFLGTFCFWISNSPSALEFLSVAYYLLVLMVAIRNLKFEIFIRTVAFCLVERSRR